MITWNYRVFRETSGNYVIREVYYDENNRILTCTQDAVEPSGETLEELKADIEYFREALIQPILTLEDIPESSIAERIQDRSANISLDELLKELEDNDFAAAETSMKARDGDG